MKLLQENAWTRLKVAKWIGTILCLIGILLTSFNIFPINIYFGLLGSAVWALVGIYQEDMPLFVVEFVAVFFYFVGVYYS
jgi:drug/metabolite transporter (DMT)-like permease